ncbi:LacI family transcriptional regulator [Amaricoccus macauensis]|uniref:LacI family transcriptional regulator n=1 Tax=Amaricoccus macauensis TaxID=57001 RepID=A0A840SM42_9RHOB|nr:LacI family DNA-binding transcriptional regulator [Amaricoccus macauensis]MBB5221800.1 LacI family transcriptional regulator [Amaricoccus macauensis]
MGNDRGGGETEGRAARPPTMMDVAAAAGVSQTTVSLVLNDTVGARLSQDTRMRVREAARTLGYTLSRPQSATGHAGSTVLGFLAEEISTDPWCAIQLEGVRQRAWESGFTVVAGVSHGDPDLEAATLASLSRQPLAGLIYATIVTRRVCPPATRVPTVLLNCFVPDHSLVSVVPAELLGGYAATLRLIRAGHRRIGHIAGQAGVDPTRDRLRGYQRALAEHDILFDRDLVRPGNWEPPTGYQAIHALMALPEPPTAIFASSDMMAMGAYEALRELGMRVPHDVSVIGYDDREIAQFLRPGLTTLLLPHHEMGMQAAAALIDGQLRPSGRQPQIKVECPVVERDSVGPPRRGQR